MAKSKNNILRPHAEDAYADELKALSKLDSKNKPENWNLSPKSVVTYICLLYTSPSPRDATLSRMPSSA